MRFFLDFGYSREESEKRKNTISQMRLGSVFKMRMSILSTATTEQMGYSIFSFFVYTKSTTQHLLPRFTESLPYFFWMESSAASNFAIFSRLFCLEAVSVKS